MHPALTSIRIRTRRTRLLERHGEHVGHLRGRGMELDELSEYVSGDPLHSINWRATARSGRPIVNRFHPTQQLSVHLVLALSGSLLFGKPTKQSVATQVLTALSSAVLTQRDRLGVTLFDDRPRWQLAPTRRQGADEAIWEAASSIDLHRSAIDYPALQHYLLTTIRHPSVIFVIGDFLTLPALDALASRHALHLIGVRSPEEEMLTLRGSHRLFDPVTGEEQRITITSRVAARYREALRVHDASLGTYCREHRIDRIMLHTDRDPIAALAGHLRKPR